MNIFKKIIDVPFVVNEWYFKLKFPEEFKEMSRLRSKEEECERRAVEAVCGYDSSFMYNESHDESLEYRYQRRQIHEKLNKKGYWREFK